MHQEYAKVSLASFFYGTGCLHCVQNLMEIAFTTFQGAYTGVCSAQHVPSYKNNIGKFKEKGIDSVICVAVNDPYVMNGWAEKLEAKEAVSFL